MKYSILLIINCLFFLCSSSQEVTLSSPDKALQMKVFFNKERQPMYSVISDGQVAIECSPLGLILDSISMKNNLRLIDSRISKVKTEEFEMVTGKQAHIKEQYKEATLTLENERKNIMQIILRAYNTGIAFRYKMIFGNANHMVDNELTGFNLPNGKAWAMPYDDPDGYSPAYEAPYQNELDVNAQSPTQAGWAFPALFLVNNRWVLISESDNDENYCSIHLSSPINGLYKVCFPEQGEANGLYSQNPQVKGNWQSPWRVVVVGKELSTIFENNLISALARPSVIQDISWISPGVASWSWWWDNDSPEDYNKLKAFIDFGYKMRWQNSLVDAKWNLMKDGDIKQLCQYAKDKGINVWVWYNSGGKHNGDGLGPRNMMDQANIRDAEFKRITKMGIKGIKVDYFHSDKQEIIKLYVDILRDAAKYKLMVNFHGCKLPNGWQRTYPHLMTMEAVRGAECYKLDPKYPEGAAVRNSILPFTRNVIGSMDYTPSTFSMHKYHHNTSNAHELALSVLFESGIQHLADDYKMYEQQPSFVLDFLMKLPTAWNKSIFLNGYPGRNVIVARKKGQSWFIAGINSEKMSKEYILKFPFLNSKSSKLKLICDGVNNSSFKEYNTEVNNLSEIVLTMLPEGGFCGIIE